MRGEHGTWSRAFGEELGPKVLAHGSVYEMTAYRNMQSGTHLPALRESHTQGTGTVGSRFSAASVNFRHTARCCEPDDGNLHTLRESENRVLRITFKTSEAAGNRRAYKSAESRDSGPALLREYYQEMGGARGTRIYSLV